METRKVIGVICAIYAVLMAISIVVGFMNPYGKSNFVIKQLGGIIGFGVSSVVAWYLLRDEKVIPLENNQR